MSHPHPHPHPHLTVNTLGNQDEAETVVLLSSIASTHEAWSKVIPALENTYRVVTVDHRGHGASQTPDAEPGTTTIQLLCEDTLRALDSVGVRYFAVVGVSLGGALAQWLAANSGRVTRAVFACTAPFLGGEEWYNDARTVREQGMEAIADDFVAGVFTEQFREHNAEEYQRMRDTVAGVDAEGYAQNCDALATWDFTDQLDKITCPSLVIAAAEDGFTPPAEVEKIAQGVGGPVEFVVIDRASHQVAVENPDAFNEALLSFLQK
ncbi:3-oxoadipate enol-lactonase 2 [Corynebacterium glaucum]|uniref:3-oxoadipate enol-lactonase 2 n=1 Tax=Corynebacterium glaucum TaxID=187491 RepID=A0A1Q2HYI7_9CORY|nr:alpha/beta fold hydrolase [Corynebacterium glaucum]AQQ15911.1 3-oxoadipate enol-lactonase 2 [Corynebacterium glaucum]